MKKWQVMFKTEGVQRSAVILSDALTTMQFRRIGIETGINKWERFTDSSAHADWAVQGETWLTQGEGPRAKVSRGLQGAYGVDRS